MIEETEFPYLFQEICIRDCYHLRELQFEPDVILDIGANVGVFSSYARFLFPKALIVAVEPNPRNWQLLCKHTGHLPEIVRLNAALGTGKLLSLPVKEIVPPYFGGHNRYYTVGQLGHPQEYFDSNQDFHLPDPNLEILSLDELVERYVEDGNLLLTKIDVEGAENCIFNHEPSMNALKRSDYLTMEIHFADHGHGPIWEPDKPTIRETLSSLEETHECVLDAEHYYFQATRRTNA